MDSSDGLRAKVMDTPIFGRTKSEFNSSSPEPTMLARQKADLETKVFRFTAEHEVALGSLHNSYHGSLEKNGLGALSVKNNATIKMLDCCKRRYDKQRQRERERVLLKKHLAKRQIRRQLPPSVRKHGIH